MYEAIVAVAKVSPHPDPETHSLAVADVLGYTVIVGRDTPEGLLGVYFPTDGQLSAEYAAANDIVRRKDANGNAAGGLFDENRKVRSQTIRKVRSEGYFAPLSSLAFTGDVSHLKQGDRLTEVNGVPICNKWVAKATRAQGASRAKNVDRKNEWFFKHVDTEQFRFAADLIEPGSMIHITEKLHGTSARHAKIWDKTNVTTGRWWWKRTREVETIENLVGTRNVILGKSTGVGYYGDGDADFRRKVADTHIDNLHVGEIVYGEIVGYLPSGQAVMGGHDTSALKDKKLLKQYGSVMHYSYGNPVGQNTFYVYRITHTTYDGHQIELPWWQVKARAAELGLLCVPEIEEPYIYTGVVESLKGHVASLLEEPSILDASHIREGVVLRVESPNGRTKFLKSKSFSFGVLEGYQKESDDYVDTEEVA